MRILTLRRQKRLWTAEEDQIVGSAPDEKIAARLNCEELWAKQSGFLSANDPYSALKTTLKAEINADAWAALNSDTSRQFPKSKSGRIAVKVINHLGDEVMKVFKV